jgi:hypothetical protein
MTNRVGLWIDRKQAVIVALDGTRASVTRLQSGRNILSTGGRRV